jgi:Transglutaminase-like superfamily
MDQPSHSFVPVALPKSIKGKITPYKLNGGGSLAQGRTYQIPGWNRLRMGQRLAFLRTLIEGDSEDSGWMKDPQIKEMARWIIGKANVDPYQHPEQAWAALLDWVQKNVKYVNEPGEQFQSPQYTLDCALRGMGGADCDDLVILLASLGGSIGLPWRMVLYGANPKTGQRVRYVESPRSGGEGVSFLLWTGKDQTRTIQMVIGGPVPEGVRWSHIYLACGLGALRASVYTFAEPTLAVPLGWDALEQRYDGGRPDLKGMGSLGGVFAGASEPAEQNWLATAWDDIKANVKPGQVVAAALPSILVLLAAPYLTKKRRR